MNPPRKAIFFDAAGTLFELAEPVGTTYAHAAHAFGLDSTPSALDAAFRRAWKTTPPPLHPPGQPPQDDDRQWWHLIVAKTLAEAGTSPPSPDAFEAFFARVYDHFAHASAWKLFDDVHPALHRLQQHATLHLLSNFDSRLLTIIDGLGIAPYFTTCTLSSRVGASKPHPRIFKAALSAASVDAADALHVGDEAAADQAGAQRAGIAAFLLARPSLNLLSLAEKIDREGFSHLHLPEL